ncbi:MAG TPA: hypothetical protein VLJ59_09715 [Mycobacteriales bacterium]|nr:hypothetical protein [Mycobacteriales bacterium]
MSAEKLSISLEADLAVTVRAAAAELGVSVSTWIADAAEARVRQRRLREALDALSVEAGGLAVEDIDQLVAEARRTSIVTAGTKGAA